MLFSILITSYNQSKTIGDTIQSCLSQTFKDYEIVISDDGSVDDSENVIKSFSDNRIRYFKQATNLREYANRNFLVDSAQGSYIIFIDGEDIIYPHALEIYAYYLAYFPQIGMVITHGWWPQAIYPVKLSPKDLYRLQFLDKGHLFGGNFTNLLFSRAVIIKNGMFPTNVKSGDTYMQYKLALTESALIIPDGLCWWRQSVGQVTEKLTPNYSAKDYCHLANTTNYKIEMLNSNACPLNQEEIETAKANLYGGCLRMALRWLVKFQVGKIYYLFKGLKIPSRFYSAVFIPSKIDYFKQFTGDNPLHTPPENR